MDYIEKVRSFLFGRQRAYQNVFNKENVFTEKVLADLAKFCRASKTTFHPDPRVHATLEGRREVWLRIERHLNLPPEDLWQIFNRKED